MNVKQAWYGRKSTTACPHSAMGDTDCSTDPDVTLQKVRDLCQLKMSCDLNPGGEMFGDPCGGTYKYLSLSYQCEQGKYLRTTYKYDMFFRSF